MKKSHKAELIQRALESGVSTSEELVEFVTHQRECPGDLCFNWRTKGNLFAARFHDSLDDALQKLVPNEEDHCGWSFSEACIRLDENAEHDFFEPRTPFFWRVFSSTNDRED
jgi:hypothetical protein